MNTFNRIMPFMERTLGMRNDGNMFFMGDMVSFLWKNISSSAPDLAEEIRNWRLC